MSKTIALIDWNWMGHHPTYFTHFAVAMAEVGARVVPFCPDPEDFSHRLSGENSGSNSRIERAETLWASGRSNFRPSRWRDQYDTIRFFGRLGRRLRDWEKKNGKKVDLVFFACIYDHNFEHFRLAERFFRFPWSGLYLHSRGFRTAGLPMAQWGNRLPQPERIFSGRTMRSVGMLDEGCVSRMQAICAPKPVFVFPDITDHVREPDGTGLAAKLREEARGRPIVSLTGYLQRTKGLEEFSKLLERPAMRDVYFFLGGDVCWTALPDATRKKLEEVWRRAPNLMTYFLTLPEAAMNAVIAESDVVFAAYKDFPNSSNVLTKAAVFRRPVVVSEGYLMAERVRRYELGKVVPEGDVEALTDAITRMIAPGYHEAMSREAKWAVYSAEHSVERLRDVMKRVVASVLLLVCAMSNWWS